MHVYLQNKAIKDAIFSTVSKIITYFHAFYIIEKTQNDVQFKQFDLLLLCFFWSALESCYVRRSGQISKRHISETAKDNPINMVLYTHKIEVAL